MIINQRTVKHLVNAIDCLPVNVSQSLIIEKLNAITVNNFM